MENKPQEKTETKLLNIMLPEELMERVKTYCYEIWIEFLSSGFKWIYRFFDMDHNEITECLACENEPNEEDLEPCCKIGEVS